MSPFTQNGLNYRSACDEYYFGHAKSLYDNDDVTYFLATYAETYSKMSR